MQLGPLRNTDEKAYPPFDATRIQGLLSHKDADAGAFFRLTCLAETSSTNDEIKQAIRRGAPEGCAAMALQQQAGYGRQGRGWASPPGGLYLSLLLKPADRGKGIQDTPSFGLAAALAVRSMLRELGCPDDVTVKWPNDVLCARGKLCGISLEAVGGALCIGIGINIFEPATEEGLEGKNTPAYAMDIMQSGVISPFVSSDGLSKGQMDYLEEAASLLLEKLFCAYALWLDKGFASVQEEYERHSSLIGQKVFLSSAIETVLSEGIVCGFDEQGRMHLKDDKGKEFAVTSGEVHIIA